MPAGERELEQASLPRKRRRRKTPGAWYVRLGRWLISRRAVRLHIGFAVALASLTGYLCGRHGTCLPEEPERFACVVCAAARPVTVWLDLLYRPNGG